MKVIELRLKPNNGRSLKAFADIELDDGIVIRDMRVVQKQEDQRPYITCPQIAWKDSSGEMRYKTIIVLPTPIKTKIDALILSRWMEAKEKEHEENRKYQ